MEKLINMESVKKTDISYIYLLHRCLLRDDRFRWSSTQLLDHSFLKEPVPALLPPPDKEESEQKKDGKPLSCSFCIINFLLRRSVKV